MDLRATEPERLDLETPPRAALERVVGYLAFVNRWLGGTRAVAAHLKGERGLVLDVASGAGDIPRALARRFPELRFVAFDLSEAMLSFAGGLPRVRGDVRRLPFADRSVDWVISTHFFHHLTDEQAVAALREFDRVARRGIVVNDLLRNRRALFWIRIFTLAANEYVKADGPQSVRRGFRVAEAEALAARAGLPWLRVRRHFGHRFTLAGVRS
ncbi:MAG TPA: methyltransferase domain-containing protein [Planctomycetota bacterium]|nr:methyltransferase domain-containing protein [Planctomycetota bacterium]